MLLPDSLPSEAPKSQCLSPRVRLTDDVYCKSPTLQCEIPKNTVATIGPWLLSTDYTVLLKRLTTLLVGKNKKLVARYFWYKHYERRTLIIWIYCRDGHKTSYLFYQMLYFYPYTCVESNLTALWYAFKIIWNLYHFIF